MLEAGLWPPLVYVARQLYDMWLGACMFGDMLLEAAMASQTSLRQAGDRSCSLSRWLSSLQCADHADISMGRLSQRVEAACSTQLERFKIVSVDAEVCPHRHQAIYVQHFAISTFGRVPKHYFFNLPVDVIRKYVLIANSVTDLPAHALHDKPFSARICPFCADCGGDNVVCTVHHVVSSCSGMAHFRIWQDFAPKMAGNMRQWLTNNYTAEGVQYIVKAVDYFAQHILTAY